MKIEEWKKQIISGVEINRQQAVELVKEEVEALCGAADEIRSHFCGNAFDLCTIMNAKSGRCSENCKYCAQSAHYEACVEEYPLLAEEPLRKGAIYNEENGILRYSLVTSGRTLSDAEVVSLCKTYRTITGACGISLCASHGLLTQEQFVRLKEAGVNRYHNNLETSRSNFENICTTHTYEDKIAAITAAQKAGLEVCSGGIFGLGESMEERIDMAFELKRLHIQSIPINILNPIKGTPLGCLPILDIEEIRKSVAIFRFILPKAALRLAGGRGLLEDKGASLFRGGANAAISGDMLTTLGSSIKEDQTMIKNLGFEVKKL